MQKIKNIIIPSIVTIFVLALFGHYQVQAINTGNANSSNTSSSNSSGSSSSTSSSSTTNSTSSSSSSSSSAPNMSINQMTSSSLSTSSISPSSSTTNSTSSSSSSSSSSSTSTSLSHNPTTSSTARGMKANDFTEWVKNSCYHLKGPSQASCEREKVKDVVRLNAVIQKEQNYCSALSGLGKTECSNSLETSLSSKKNIYLNDTPDQSQKNKEYREANAKITNEYNNTVSQCEKKYKISYRNPTNSDVEAAETKENECVFNASVNKEISKCIAKKKYRETGSGGKYNIKKYAPAGPIKDKDIPGLEKKALEQMKKDCIADINKKMMALGRVH